jgi:uroporphyrinogen-III synthase
VSEGPRVWITRAEPGASATASRLSALGFQPLVAPLLSVQPLDIPVDLEGVGALAFTSRNGVQAFCEKTPVRDLPVFAVGEATARAARAAGFAPVLSSDEDVSALARLIAGAKPSGTVLHPTGVHRAGDLIGALHRAGLRARSVALYDTPATKVVPAIVAEALRSGTLSAIFIHSPRAAAILANVAADFDYSSVQAFGLSPACLAPLAALGFCALTSAAAAREDALLEVLSSGLGNSRRRR